jgi:hypothetical protein
MYGTQIFVVTGNVVFFYSTPIRYSALTKFSQTCDYQKLHQFFTFYFFYLFSPFLSSSSFFTSLNAVPTVPHFFPKTVCKINILASDVRDIYLSVLEKCLSNLGRFQRDMSPKTRNITGICRCCLPFHSL